MRHGPAAPSIFLGTQSTMSDVISESIRAGEETHGWNASKSVDVQLVCLEKITSAISVSVLNSVLVGIRIPSLVPAGKTAYFLPWLPLEENWGKDLPDMLICLLSLICWFLTKTFLHRVLWQIHVLPTLPQVHAMFQAPGGVLGTDDPLLVME